MNEQLGTLGSTVRMIDAIDILFVSFIVYRILLLIKGTRAMQMLTGLCILTISYFLSSTFELYTTHWLLSHFIDYLVIIIIVLFQDDLRKALTNVGKNPFFSSQALEDEKEMIEEVSKAATQLAKEKTGALIVFERETGLKNYIDSGSKVDSAIKAEVLYSLFNTQSPLHDGAVIIRNGRLDSAGCFLPLSKDNNIDKKYGTRHRAALGISEETDAIVVLVSEEAGEAHIVRNGTMITNLSESELVNTLTSWLSNSFVNHKSNFIWAKWLKYLSIKSEKK